MEKLAQKLEQLWDENLARFPFANYINPARKSAYSAMPTMLFPHVKPGAKILDFGCGPLDKTFMFKSLTDEIYAFDTLDDIWHKVDGNASKIKKFAADSDITFLDRFDQIAERKYDVIMLHDVIEHFHESPRLLLNSLIGCLEDGGLLVLTVPNAGNIRKRLHLLMGGTNYPRYGYFYWYPGKWDGHVREYVRGDLTSLSSFLGLNEVELKTFHIHLDVLPAILRPVWVLLSKLVPNTRDSFYLISEKPVGWEARIKPTSSEFEQSFGRQYFSRLLDYDTVDWE